MSPTPLLPKVVAALIDPDVEMSSEVQYFRCDHHGMDTMRAHFKGQEVLKRCAADSLDSFFYG